MRGAAVAVAHTVTHTSGSQNPPSSCLRRQESGGRRLMRLTMEITSVGQSATPLGEPGNGVFRYGNASKYVSAGLTAPDILTLEASAPAARAPSVYGAPLFGSVVSFPHVPIFPHNAPSSTRSS